MRSVLDGIEEDRMKDRVKELMAAHGWPEWFAPDVMCAESGGDDTIMLDEDGNQIIPDW